ncbi:hypothetical protein D3C80_2201680 [compost metagenome]
MKHSAVSSDGDDDFRRFGVKLHAPSRRQLVKLLAEIDGQLIAPVQDIISQGEWTPLLGFCHTPIIINLGPEHNV